jgi:hypothetical protein
MTHVEDLDRVKCIECGLWIDQDKDAPIVVGIDGCEVPYCPECFANMIIAEKRIKRLNSRKRKAEEAREGNNQTNPSP